MEYNETNWNNIYNEKRTNNVRDNIGLLSSETAILQLFSRDYSDAVDTTYKQRVGPVKESIYGQKNNLESFEKWISDEEARLQISDEDLTRDIIFGTLNEFAAGGIAKGLSML